MNKSIVKKALIAASIVGAASKSENIMFSADELRELREEEKIHTARSGGLSGKRSKGDRKRNPRWRRQ